MDESPRPLRDHRRRRPALACVSCRKSKIRCDRQDPCGACVRSRHKTCVFETHRGAASRKSGIASAAADHANITDSDPRCNQAPVTPASSTSTALPHGHEAPTVLPSPEPASVDSAATVPDADVVLNRLFRLERRLDESTTSRQLPEKPEKPDRRAPARNEDDTIVSYLAADVHPMSRGVVSKTRYFGQSHWMSGIVHFKPILELFEQQSKDTKSEAITVLNRCKTLGRTIKAQRSPGVITKFGTNTPPRDVADELVDAYLRTLETVFRVLHVPSFKRDYERFWTAPDAVGMPFVIQLQLVMAIGCTIYDESFSMRKSAVQWVTEAQYWLLTPSAKSILTITGLQIMILLGLARETASVGGDLVWIHVGSLLRSALYMGLHRDPSRLPKMSRLDAEMRRRLWNTILEIELQTSFGSGGFPMVSLDGSDTQAPADLDDADLVENDPPTSPETDKKFTDMTVALAFRDSFRERLAICQMLNAIPFRGTYEDTIRLHGRFTTAFKSLTNKLKSYPSSERQPTPFQCRFVELVIRRCLMSLHLPYLGPGLKNPAFAFSRKLVTETAVKTYYLIFPSARLGSAQSSLLNEEGPEIVSTEGDDLARFTVCAAGFWRLLASQASMVVALELQTAAQEDDGLGPPMPRPDLLNILRHSISLHLSRIKAGETNVKGYLFTVALKVHIEALTEGRTGPAYLEPILSATIRTEKMCYELLKQQAGSTECADMDSSSDAFNWSSLITVDEVWGDYGGSLFDISSVESFLGASDGFDFMSPAMPCGDRS
ncbi:hypothetical protein F5Y19DRAFT_488168 [Xylariaceae sp. FL1651]|nr:hypothetical protein F5Y19DRAFT_488168 [Xylariaceae sp. FL1651]